MQRPLWQCNSDILSLVIIDLQLQFDEFFDAHTIFGKFCKKETWETCQIVAYILQKLAVMVQNSQYWSLPWVLDKYLTVTIIQIM